MAQSSKSRVRRLYWRPGRYRFFGEKFRFSYLTPCGNVSRHCKQCAGSNKIFSLVCRLL